MAGHGKLPKTLSAGVVPVRRSPAGCRYLLLRAYTYWDFPKGEVAAGEAPQQTAIREVEEETGLTDLHFKWGDVYRETPVYSHGKVARYYVAECPTGEVVLRPNPELGRPEHHAFRWVTLDEARALLGERVWAIAQWAAGLAES